MVRRRQAITSAELSVETGQDLGRGHRANAGGGELDRQRQAIEPRTQPVDRRLRVLVRHELRPPLACAFDEDADGASGPQPLLSPTPFPPCWHTLASSWE